MPLPIGVGLVALGLIFIHKHKLKSAKLVLFLSIVWFFLFSYPPLVRTLLSATESGYPTLQQAPEGIKYIYVLGGGHSSDANLPITSQIGAPYVIRLTEAIRLYHQLHENANIIVSGYGAGDEIPHAFMQKRLALALGVKEEHIIVEPLPKDTKEEAQAAKKLLKEKPFILVTSASHMKRAMDIFNKEGLHPVPAPTYHTASKKDFNTMDVFSYYSFTKSRAVFHETLGLLWEKIKDIR